MPISSQEAQVLYWLAMSMPWGSTLVDQLAFCIASVGSPSWRAHVECKITSEFIRGYVRSQKAKNKNVYGLLEYLIGMIPVRKCIRGDAVVSQESKTWLSDFISQVRLDLQRRRSEANIPFGCNLDLSVLFGLRSLFSQFVVRDIFAKGSSSNSAFSSLFKLADCDIDILAFVPCGDIRALHDGIQATKFFVQRPLKLFGESVSLAVVVPNPLRGGSAADIIDIQAFNARPAYESALQTNQRVESNLAACLRNVASAFRVGEGEVIDQLRGIKKEGAIIGGHPTPFILTAMLGFISVEFFASLGGLPDINCWFAYILLYIRIFFLRDPVLMAEFRVCNIGRTYYLCEEGVKFLAGDESSDFPDIPLAFTEYPRAGMRSVFSAYSICHPRRLIEITEHYKNLTRKIRVSDTTLCQRLLVSERVFQCRRIDYIFCASDTQFIFV